VTNRLAVLAVCCVFSAAALGQSSPKPAPAKAAEPLRIPYPDWLFPIDDDAMKAYKLSKLPKSPTPPTPTPKETTAPAAEELLEIPDSDQRFTLARINDKFNAPDWHPADHGPMPDIVAKGRKPKIIACAFCHTPTGQGRPENSALAGLPEAYIKEQLLDFRSGKRGLASPDFYAPFTNMLAVAAAMTDAEIDESARYFAQQKLRRRHYVVEGVNIPRAEPAFWVYKEVGGSEDLGERLLEVAPDIQRHERRDDRMQYTVYAPAGSLALGKALATTGNKGKTMPCTQCHLANLKGDARVPPIAGRSPTYLLRQLLAFKNGTRTGEAAAQMGPTVEKLELDDMIALAAYVGSLYP